MRKLFEDTTNLLEETVNMLTAHNKKPEDVRWVGNNQIYTDWDNFANVAESANYDAGYGSPEIPMDLLVVGEDFWLERHEYDGSEWWEYKTLPTKPKEKVIIKALTVEQAKHNKITRLPIYGLSLCDLNGRE